ncbi:MAG: AAA family ATPase [Tunicatimonas sp.]
MQIQRLYIESYKRLQNFEIEFRQPVSLLIGRNGSGKSSLLEALAWIFRSAHLTYVEEKPETPPFNFEITYEVLLEQTNTSEASSITVTLTGNRQQKNFWSIQAEHVAYSSSDLVQTYGYSLLLPSNILIYYAGWSTTMDVISQAHEALYREKLRLEKSNTDLSIAASDLFTRVSTLPLLYVQKQHFSILLATLYAYQYSDSLDRFFAEEVKIQKPPSDTLSITIKERRWVSKATSEDFWGAQGELKNFLVLLRQYASQEANHPSNKGQVEQIVFSFDLSGWYEVRAFYGEEKKLFYLLHMLHASDMLGDINLCLQKAGKTISHRYLSEGEQQLITIRAINEVLIEKNTLLLFDEPDTYLHPHWQSKFLDNIYDCVDFTTYPPQFIIASHATIILSHFKEGNLYKMEAGKVAPPLEEGYYGRKYEFNLQNQMEEQPRPQLIQDEIDQVYVLLDEENLSKAQQLLDQLAKKLPNDPELTKAQTMITFLSE